MPRHNLHCPSQYRPLFLAVALSVAAVAPFTASVAMAASEAQRQSFDIPAGPLARQLNTLAAQTGLLLAADASLTRDRQSQAVRGSYSAEQALVLMLAGTGLVAERKDGRPGRYARAERNRDHGSGHGPGHRE